MIVPTVSDVVHCIADTLDKVIGPAVDHIPQQKSAVATVRHMLRLVETRIDLEGQLLFDEIAKLRPLLADAAAYLEGHAGGKVAAEIRAALGAQRDASVYPSPSILAREVGELRRLICEVQDAVRPAAIAGEGEGDAEALRRRLLAYVTWQLEQEGKLIGPAFMGHGPRR